MPYTHVPAPADHLDPIDAMAEGIASATSTHEVFRTLFTYATRTTPTTGIFVALYTPSTGLRRCVYAANRITGEDGTPLLEEDTDLTVYPEIPLNTGPQSAAILTGEIINTPDLDAAVVGLPRVDEGSDFDDNPPKSSLAVPFGLEGRTLGVFEVQSPHLDAFHDQHIKGLRFAARLAGIAVENLDLLERQRAQHEGVLRALGLALEYRDYETKGHTDRVVALSLAFGEALAIDAATMQALRWGAYLHDLGKVAIPDHILLKPGKLTDAEFDVIRKHTLIGIEMCSEIPFLEAATREIVRSHHERWDGRGYPDRLVGENIPLLARMFSLVDVYDALTSERPYKQAWTHEATIAELEASAGSQFDPGLVPTFKRIATQFREESKEYGDPENVR